MSPILRNLQSNLTRPNGLLKEYSPNDPEFIKLNIYNA